jgi:broad specificity phosphatase PhoE
MELFLIRHGQTAWSKEGRYTGSTDQELTDDGRVEARRTGRVLRAMTGSQLHFDSIWASPMSRATNTATLIFGETSEFRTCDLLRELNFGELEGMTIEELRRSWPDRDLWQTGGPSGESAAELNERARQFVETYLVESERSAVIGHGYILRAIAICAVGLAPEVGTHLVLDTGSVSLIGDRHGRRAIIHWNVTTSLILDSLDGAE